jgi:hypothetical protein
VVLYYRFWGGTKMNYDILAMNSEDSDYIDDKIVEYNLSKMPAECEGNQVVEWFGKK